MSTWTIYPDQRKEIVRQIGAGNILCISGGKINPIPDGIELPVSNGFLVRIQLTPLDEYTVTRVFKRSGKEFIHGRAEHVYCDRVSELAYRAGMFRSWSADKWMTGAA